MISRQRLARSGIDEILDESITAAAVSSSACRCDGCASSELHISQDIFIGSGPLFKAMGLPQPTSGPEDDAAFMSKLLPLLAARLFDPAGGHKLAAVQDALQVVQRQVPVMGRGRHTTNIDPTAVAANRVLGQNIQKEQPVLSQPSCGCVDI